MERFPLTYPDAKALLGMDDDDMARGYAHLGALDQETSAGEWADACAAAEVLGGVLEIGADGVTFYSRRKHHCKLRRIGLRRGQPWIASDPGRCRFNPEIDSCDFHDWGKV
jgi:hypothetical protein